MTKPLTDKELKPFLDRLLRSYTFEQIAEKTKLSVARLKEIHASTP